MLGAGLEFAAPIPGVVEGGMSRRIDFESLEPVVVSLGRMNRHSSDRI